MKPENLKKMKEAIMDELNCGEELAEFCAKSAMVGIRNGIVDIVESCMTEQQETAKEEE